MQCIIGSLSEVLLLEENGRFSVMQADAARCTAMKVQ